MSDWQPIETAPIGRRLRFWWRPVGDNPYAECEVFGSLGYDDTAGQWWTDCGEWKDAWHLTHWKPLDEPPEEREITLRRSTPRVRDPAWSPRAKDPTWERSPGSETRKGAPAETGTPSNL